MACPLDLVSLGLYEVIEQTVTQMVSSPTLWNQIIWKKDKYYLIFFLLENPKIFQGWGSKLHSACQKVLKLKTVLCLIGPSCEGLSYTQRTKRLKLKLWFLQFTVYSFSYTAPGWRVSPGEQNSKMKVKYFLSSCSQIFLCASWK